MLWREHDLDPNVTKYTLQNRRARILNYNDNYRLFGGIFIRLIRKIIPVFIAVALLIIVISTRFNGKEELPQQLPHLVNKSL
jgi:hypothetical protein